MDVAPPTLGDAFVRGGTVAAALRNPPTANHKQQKPLAKLIFPDEAKLNPSAAFFAVCAYRANSVILRENTELDEF
jgi:hypothetical protein